MNKTILITGGKGFLGQAVAREFKQRGYFVQGIGHGAWDNFSLFSFDVWHDAHINLTNLSELKQQFDVIVHCAGNGSVQDARNSPLQSFNNTVQSSIELLEYIRLYQPNALLIYPSSAAVYGATIDAPISIHDKLNPISAYGYHKKIIEELCELYMKEYNLQVAIVRLFSIYGPGLKKQLLWDAAAKLKTNKEALFWGTGEETRDWIHVEDAARLILLLSEQSSSFTIVNGANGIRVTVREIIEMLYEELDASVKIIFNNQTREGDPKFYFADVSQTKLLGWAPQMALVQGIQNYASWFKEQL